MSYYEFDTSEMAEALDAVEHLPEWHAARNAGDRQAQAEILRTEVQRIVQ